MGTRLNRLAMAVLTRTDNAACFGSKIRQEDNRRRLIPVLQ